MKTIQYLNTILVNAEIRKRGLQKKWVIKQIGIHRSYGYSLLNDGVLPKNQVMRAEIVKKLAALIGRDEKELILTFSSLVA